MRVTSLGYRTDVALRVLEGAEVTDRGDYLVVRSPDNPAFWWGNFLLLGRLARARDRGRLAGQVRRRVPAARHVALGVDSADGGTVPRVPGRGPGAAAHTVLTCGTVQPPP